MYTYSIFRYSTMYSIWQDRTASNMVQHTEKVGRVLNLISTSLGRAFWQISCSVAKSDANTWVLQKNSLMNLKNYHVCFQRIPHHSFVLGKITNIYFLTLDWFTANFSVFQRCKCIKYVANTYSTWSTLRRSVLTVRHFQNVIFK